MAEQLTFDFITDEELRASLESDYSELATCLRESAWKAAHVMSGSIVEAVLVDYLVSVKYEKADPLTMTLEDLITAAKAEGVLSQKAAELSTVIRGFRNLIHPGRIARLKENVDEDGARVANALVSMIVREVAAKQAQEFGLTADQLLAKFENDPSAFGIADHLLREAQDRELERLLLQSLPDRYLTLAETGDFIDFSGELVDNSGTQLRLARLYVEAYDVASPEVQKKVVKRYVKVLREESGFRVDIYEQQFFRGYFLEHLSEPERRLVKDHLLSRLQGTVPTSLVHVVEGLGTYLKPNEAPRLFDNLVRVLVYTSSEEDQGRARDSIESEYSNLPTADHQERVKGRLEAWVEFLHEKELTDEAERVERLLVDLRFSDDVPF